MDVRRPVKSGFVAVAGRPNVGKSTLVNALVGEKIAITSTVPNTTRRRIYGVANGEDYQLVLADLPGFQKPMDKLTTGCRTPSTRPSRTSTSSSSSFRRATGSVPATASSPAGSTRSASL